MDGPEEDEDEATAAGQGGLLGAEPEIQGAPVDPAPAVLLENGPAPLGTAPFQWLGSLKEYHFELTT